MAAKAKEIEEARAKRILSDVRESAKWLAKVFVVMVPKI